MITFLTTAKPFIGSSYIHQVNAIKSWRLLSPDVEVMLFGEGIGYSQVAQELGLVQIPNVETSEQGTPLINSIFSLAHAHANNNLMVYINCDIILTDDFLPAIQKIGFDPFLAVGLRSNLDFDQKIDFADPLWSQELRQLAQARGSLVPYLGSDYFAYRGDFWNGLPPLVVGRPGFDNVLIYHARKAHIPVVDITPMVTAVHQNHDYSHTPGGRAEIYEGPEAKLNYRTLEKMDTDFIFTPLEADWLLSTRGLVKNYAHGDWDRYLQSSVYLAQGTVFEKPLMLIFILVRFAKQIFRAAAKLTRLGPIKEL